VLAAEDLSDPEIGDLEVSVFAEQEVLELDVSVSDAVTVQIVHAANELLEEAQTVVEGVVPAFGGKELAINQGVDFAVVAEFHDVVPVAVMVAQTHSLNYVGMM